MSRLKWTELDCSVTSLFCQFVTCIDRAICEWIVSIGSFSLAAIVHFWRQMISLGYGSDKVKIMSFKKQQQIWLFKLSGSLTHKLKKS